MKSFTVGLLLLTVYCTATPLAMNAVAPGSCCFQFFTGRIPAQKIISVIKTHRECPGKGFVVSTASGSKICVGQNQPWAQAAYLKQVIIA